MCTVSYVPVGPQKFILTSNRDETAERGLASLPQRIKHGDVQIICPKDPLANGSWIAMSGHGALSCLLNGAYVKHKRKLPYRKSRGMVVLDSLTYQAPQDFALKYDFAEIEPFTMVMSVTQPEIQLYELRWDSERVHFNPLLKNEFHLWSSVTLYDDEVVGKKELAFKEYLHSLEEIVPASMMDMHQQHFRYEQWVHPPQRVQEVATLSITSVEYNSNQLRMLYRDLVRKELPLYTLS